ncbi:MAG TPA: ECF-type sigma factor [Bryobacteraceae bacterium]|nr:ECF-type sigma factor [Bryobacteraceae bacterium]
MTTGEGKHTSGKELLVLLYRGIRLLARQRLSTERPNHTLNTTALVNELYLRLAHNDRPFRSEGEFVAAASKIIRHILVDHARARNRQKRGGSEVPLQLASLQFDIYEGHSIGVEALDRALTELANIDERQARVVEMRFFGGLSMLEIAHELGVSSKTVNRDWALARSWLKASLQ